MHEDPGLISRILLSQAVQCPWFHRLEVEKFKVIPDNCTARELLPKKKKERKKNYDTHHQNLHSNANVPTEVKLCH